MSKEPQSSRGPAVEAKIIDVTSSPGSTGGAVWPAFTNGQAASPSSATQFPNFRIVPTTLSTVTSTTPEPPMTAPTLGWTDVEVVMHRLPVRLSPPEAAAKVGAGANAYSLTMPDYDGDRCYRGVALNTRLLTAKSKADEVVDVVQLLAGPLLLSRSQVWLYLPGVIEEVEMAAACRMLQGQAKDRFSAHCCKNERGSWSVVLELRG